MKGEAPAHRYCKVTIIHARTLRIATKFMRGNVLLLIVFFYGFIVTGRAQSSPKIRFIENRNQWSEEVDFGVRVSGGDMFVGPGRFRYYFLDQQKLEELHDRS